MSDPRHRRFAAKAFQALAVRNYRLYVCAQVVSTSGTWVQLVAENWLVVRLTHSGLALGITTALQFTPLLVLGAYGGVIVDRLDKRRLLIATQGLAGALALSIGTLALAGVVRVWMVWVAALLLGVVNAADSPARQAFTVEMVGPSNIANAVGLNSAVATCARALGPAIGGLLIATVGVGACFMVNAATFVAVIATLAGMRTGELHIGARTRRAPGQVRDGFAYVRRDPTLRGVLVTLVVAAIFATNFQVLLPLLASQTFHRGGGTYGLLMAAMGAGSVLGSLIVASLSTPRIGRVALLAVGFALTVALVGVAPVLPVAFGAAALMGVGFSMFVPSCAATLQNRTEPTMRGRVMALYTVAFLGTAPIGGPTIGYLAQAMGPRAGFLVGAAGCLVAAPIGLLFYSPHPLRGRYPRPGR